MSKVVLVLALLMFSTTAAYNISDMIASAPYHMAASFVTYCPVFVVENRVPAVGEKLYGVYESTEGEKNMFFVLRDDRSQILVSFRGSLTIMNYVSNFDIIKTRLGWEGVPEDVEVHHGFYSAYMRVQEMVITLVNAAKADCPDCQIVLSGHSLGGAMATLCALDLKLQGESPQLYTYGQPRTGNKQFAQYFNSLSIPTVRYVNSKDMVPHIPLRNAMGYEHIAGEVWDTEDAVKICDDAAGEDESCSYSIPVVYCNPFDHKIYLGRDADDCFDSLFDIF